MNVRSWFSGGDSQKETVAKRGFAAYDKYRVVNPIKLKVMMRGEVLDGKPKGPNGRLLEDTLEQRASNPESMSVEEEKAVGIFMDWRVGGQISPEEADYLNRYLDLGLGEQIEAGQYEEELERFSVQSGEMSPKTPLGLSLPFREAGSVDETRDVREGGKRRKLESIWRDPRIELSPSESDVRPKEPSSGRMDIPKMGSMEGERTPEMLEQEKGQETVADIHKQLLKEREDWEREKSRLNTTVQETADRAEYNEGA
jgi:hypothetical protein